MPILPGAEPYRHDGGATGVLLVHGFTGSPVSLRPWAQSFSDAGFTVEVPRLPGHGTRWEDLAVTGWDDWYAEVDRSLTGLLERCDRVVVGGLSMGGTLALRLGELRPADVAALLLVNPSVHTERRDRHLLPVARFLVRSFPGITNDIRAPGRDEGGYSRMPLRSLHSLSKAWVQVKADLPLVTAPILVMHSRVDHVVEPSSSAAVLERVSSDLRAEVWLEESFHVATLDNDLPLIVSESHAFVRSVVTPVG